MIRDNKSDIGLLQETKMSKEKIESLHFFSNGRSLGGDAEGASGGIVFMWNCSIIRGVISQGNNMASVRFWHIKDGTSWVLTNIYAPNTKWERKSFWT